LYKFNSKQTPMGLFGPIGIINSGFGGGAS